jgi:hypothetical protein
MPRYYGKIAISRQARQALTEKQGAIDEFLRRLHAIRERHARKERFIERLAAIG